MTFENKSFLFAKIGFLAVLTMLIVLRRKQSIALSDADNANCRTLSLLNAAAASDPMLVAKTKDSRSAQSLGAGPNSSVKLLGCAWALAAHRERRCSRLTNQYLWAGHMPRPTSGI